ncbi:MAG: endonuclease III domain-containing protein [Spirochaetota bacterium]
MSTVISLRTRDDVTFEVSKRVLEVFPNVESLARTDSETLAASLYPAAFYRNKAQSLIRAAESIVNDFGGAVPSDEEFLLSLPGVGRKTAQLVRAEAFGIPAICVDIHVHRISNRLGICTTQTAEETERALEQYFKMDDWIRVNRIIVPFGQQICTPVSPWCTRCPLQTSCPRNGVTRSR